MVASVLSVPMHKVLIDMRRMGGGFGGKETQAAAPACIAAVIAAKPASRLSSGSRAVKT